MNKSTKKSIYLWGGSLLALVLIVWGLSSVGGSHNSGTFEAEQLDLTSSAAFEQVKGPENAAVTVVEYSDFQCPFCAQAAPIVDQVLAEYPDDVRVVYRHFPLNQIHAQAQLASEAAEAAGNQGQFWEMHDVLFANQSQWSGNLGARGIFETYAEALGLDMEQFNTDLRDGALTDKVDHDYQSGVTAGVQGTPTFFINGERLQTPSYAGFVSAIDAELERIGEVAEATIEAGGDDADPDTVGSEPVVEDEE